MSTNNNRCLYRHHRDCDGLMSSAALCDDDHVVTCSSSFDESNIPRRNSAIDDILDSVTALKNSEVKFYFKHHGNHNTTVYDQDDSTSKFHYQQQRMKLIEWCLRLVDYFHLPRYLVEWTINLVDRYYARHYCRSNNSMEPIKNNAITQLKLMTAIALRFTIKLDAGQSIYYDEHNHYRHHQHVRAMMAIPSIMIQSMETKMDETTFTTSIVPKLEMSLLSSLGFYVHPPLTETYIDQFEQVVLQLRAAHTSNAAVLKEIKTNAISICEDALLRMKPYSIPPSCMAFCAYLSALKKVTPVNDGQNNNTNYYYYILLDTFRDILLPKTNGGNWMNLEKFIQHLSDLLLSHGNIAVSQSPNNDADSITNGARDNEDYPDSQYYHRHHSHYASSLDIRSSILGKRKASPTTTLV